MWLYYQRYKLEQNQWESSNAGMKLNINTDFEQMNERLEVCGLSVCKACSLLNITQTNIISAENQSFQRITSNPQFKLSLKNTFQEQVTQNQDVLSGIASAWNNPDVAQISTHLSNIYTSGSISNFIDDTVQIYLLVIT